MTDSFVVSSGVYLPKHVLSNEECARLAGVSPDWIIRRTGILERRVAAPSVGTAAMAAHAGREALKNAGILPDDVDLIIVATSTPDHLTPPTACEVQAELGCRGAAAFDVEAGFSAWLYALIVADALVKGGAAHTVLVIGADKLSSITDRTDPETGPLFGDGAGAIVMRAGSGLARIRSTSWWADGTMAGALVRRGGGSMLPFDANVLADRSHLLRMEGTRLFKSAVRTMAAQAEVALERAGIELNDVAMIVPHQANLRILQKFAHLVRVRWSRVFVNIDRYGNTGAATIPIALHEANLPRNAPTLLVGFGAGATAGAVVLDPVSSSP
ncbi:MAG TPA: beta-ketoacyl-ACP synthase 3 [Longimicrobiales bacterium]|nr:beta-ketoacyl-ACP synthase 3 [Longimicrobiales bacterium]